MYRHRAARVLDAKSQLFDSRPAPSNDRCWTSAWRQRLLFMSSCWQSKELPLSHANTGRQTGGNALTLTATDNVSV